MNYSQIAILLSQGTLIAFIVLVLFQFRKKLGIGLLLACLGLIQFLQVFISSSIFVSITNDFIVSPGSSILFTVTVFALLIIYIKEDASETKKVIYTLLIVNVLVTILLKLFGWNLNEISADKPFSVLTNLFDSRSWVFLTGAVTLLIDTLLIIIIFEFIARHIRFLFLQIFVTMLLVISFDTLFFLIIAFWDSDNLNSMILSGFISKGFFTLFYSIIFYLYLKYFDLSKPLTNILTIKDVFKPLTYKQKFESAEKVIQESEEMYRILTDHSKDLIFLQEPDSSFRYVSPAIKKILGYEQSEFMGKFIFSIVHKDDVQFLKEILHKKLISTGVAKEAIPFRIRHKDGHYIWLEFLSSPVYKGNEISYFVTTARDITQRVLVKEKLETSLELLEKKEHSLSESSKIAKIGFWEYDIATDTIIWSEDIFHTFGLDAKDKIPPTNEILKLYDKNSLKRIENANLNLNTKGDSYDIELKLINFKKEEIWVRNVVQPIYNQQKEIVGRRGVLQNITDAKNIQLELELSNQKIQASLELLERREFALEESSRIAKIGYWEYDIATDTFIWSDYVYEVYGFDLKDSIPSRKDIISFYDNESQDKLAKATLNLTLKNIPYDLELKLLNLKKEEVWVRNVVQLIFNEQNEIIGRRGVLHNITDSKKVQFALELSKQKLQSSLKLLEKSEYSKDEASKMAKIGFLEDDIATDTFTWSESLYHIFGFDPKEPVPERKEIAVLFDEESQKKMEIATLKLDSKGISFDLELRMVNLRKEEVWTRIVVEPVYNEQNEIVGRRGALQDISNSKKTQLELEFSKQKIQDSLELSERIKYSMDEASKVAKMGYWEHDTITDTVVWSEYVHRLFGSNPEKGIPAQEEIIETFTKESQEKLAKATLNLTLKGLSYDIELNCINLKNEEIWVRNVAQAIYNEQNEIVGKRGVLHNITASKKAQLELEFSKRKIQNSLALLEKRKYSMEEASKVAKMGYHEYDFETDTFTWSEYLYHIFGINAIKVLSRQEVLEFFDKESKEKITLATEELDNKGTPYDLELKIINGRKEEVWVRNVTQPIYNQQNEIIGRRGVTQDITTSKKAQLEIEVSKEKIQTSLELLEKSEYSKNEASKMAKIGYWEYNVLTETIIWSDYIFEVFGVDPKEGVPPREEILKFYDEESKKKLSKANLELNSKGIFYDIEIKIINLKKETVWLRNLVQPIYNEQKEVVGRRGISQNITASKKAQFALELSREKIQTSLELLEKRDYSLLQASEMAKIGYWEYNLSTDKYIWSDYVYKLCGLDLKEKILLQKEIVKMCDEESLRKLELATLNLYTNDISYDIELKIINFKNVKVWIRSVGQPIYNKHNEIIGRKGVIQDITDEKNNELKLRENEEKFFNIFKNSPNLIILTRLQDYQIVDANDAALKVTGYTPKEIINNGNFLKHVWISLENREKYFKKLIKNGEIKNYETEFVIKSGEIRFWKTSSQIIKISNEKYALSTIEDVTDIKDAQIEIQKQTEFINAMTENQPNAIIACNSEGELVLFNKKAIEWHGVDVLKISNDKWAENYGLYNTDGETLLKIEEIPLMQAFKGQKIRNREIVIRAKNKKNRTVLCNGTSFSDSDGNILGAVIVMNDVTTQKITESNLKRSESETKKALKEIERSEFLLNESGRLAKVGAWEIKLPSQEIRWSKEVFSIHGLPVGEVPPYEDCVGYYVDGSAETLAKAIEISIAKKKKFDLVLRFNNEKKQKLWVHAIGYPLTNEEGEITSLIGVFQDITEQTNKQIKLDEQNEKLSNLNSALNEAQEISHLGSWKYIIASGDVTWSQELFNIFERPFNLGAPSYPEHKLFYTEESFALMDQAVYNCIQHETPYNLELDIYTTSGTLKHVISRGRPIKDKNNNVIGCYGTALDITEQKQIRLKIEEAEKMYRILTDYSNDLICMLEPNGTFEYVSPSVKNLLGYEPSGFLGKNVFNLVHKDDVNQLKNKIEERMLKGVFNEPVTFRVLHKNGHYVWLEFLSSPVYKDNVVNYFVTSSRDITQWILAQQEIEDYQTSLQKLTTEITLIEEKQKKEIATNIHDHLSQSLVISNMKIKELKKNKNLKAIDDDLNFIYEHISEALANSRKITYELSPPVLYQLGIIDAISWLLDNIETTHKIKCLVNSNVGNVKLSDVKSILLYRSIQEVINNVIKYAKASLITLDFDKNKLGLTIFVTDNGVGFNTSVLNNLHNHSGSGFGLFTVQERIQNIQGKFTIKSKINIGTTVKFFIPLAKNELSKGN